MQLRRLNWRYLISTKTKPINVKNIMTSKLVSEILKRNSFSTLWNFPEKHVLEYHPRYMKLKPGSTKHVVVVFQRFGNGNFYRAAMDSNTFISYFDIWTGFLSLLSLLNLLILYKATKFFDIVFSWVSLDMYIF